MEYKNYHHFRLCPVCNLNLMNLKLRTRKLHVDICVDVALNCPTTEPTISPMLQLNAPKIPIIDVTNINNIDIDKTDKNENSPNMKNFENNYNTDRLSKTRITTYMRMRQFSHNFNIIESSKNSNLSNRKIIVKEPKKVKKRLMNRFHPMHCDYRKNL